MTWRELKITVLQKVFAITDGKMLNDDTTREYLTAIPGAANEGLQLLATGGRFLKREALIVQGGGTPEGAECPVLRGELGTGVNRYDLERELPDFYSMDADGLYTASGVHCRPADWTMEAGRVLVLSAQPEGVWRLWYNAYPRHLTAETDEDYELPLYPEMAALLPLYIASQVYKDDDVAMAVQYRNEFEVGREALRASAQRGLMGRDYWRSVTGWW